MDTEPRSNLPSLWRDQIRRVAVRSPRLAQVLWRDRGHFYGRFVRSYRSLAALPGKLRRRLLRKLAMTLAGAAMLLALGYPLPVRAAVITVDGVVCTLAEAIDSANNDTAAGNGCADGSGADTLDLQADVILAAPLPLIESEIFLAGNGHAVDGGAANRVLEIRSGGSLTVTNTIITGGKAGVGGGILNNPGGALTVVDSIISGNTSLTTGGGIENRGSATVIDSEVLDNDTQSSGGGIYNAGELTLTGTNLQGNRTAQYIDATGGGLANSPDGLATIEAGTISQNYAYEGAGIFNRGKLVVSGTTIAENASYSYWSDLGGGGINNQPGGEVTLTGSKVLDNFAGTGGGLHNTGVMTVEDCVISANDSTAEFVSSGGAIRNKGILEITRTTIDDNQSFNTGGISNDGTLTIRESTISGNRADYSGGGISSYSGSVILVNSTISGNIAWVLNGGGINLAGGEMKLDNVTVTGNSTYYSGGGIFNDAGAQLDLNRTVISGNTVSKLGSGAEVNSLGTVAADNFNLFGYGGDPRSIGFTPGATDLVPAGALDTVLDPALADNGGPTLTHALVPGGEAVDSAPSAACLAAPVDNVDQRGAARSQDGDGLPGLNECDSGAFEFDPLPVKRYLPLINRN